MKYLRSRNFAAAIVMAVMLLVAMPATSFGKDRGRRHKRNSDWKCGRFVNCHDARDGRRDGRGFRRNDRDWRDSRWWDNRNDDSRWRNRRTSERRWWHSGSRDRWSSRDGDNRWRDNNRWRNRNVYNRWRDTTRWRTHDNRWR
jgi:hypothetical protein